MLSQNDFTPEDLAFLMDLAKRTWYGEYPKIAQPILERFGAEIENKPKVMAAFMVIADYIEEFASEGK